jgi:hypothetical protein
MSYLVIGPLIGVVLVVVMSLAGILISQMLGGSAPTVIGQIHSSAAVVLLVTILVRLESKQSKE